MSKLKFNFENNIYYGCYKALPSANGCRFFIDKREAVALYSESKMSKHVCSLASEEMYKSATIIQAVKDSDSCEYEIGVAIYDIKTKSLLQKYPALCSMYSGSALTAFVENYQYDKWAYAFYCNEYVFSDIRGERFVNSTEYGEFDKALPLLAVFDNINNFEDVKPDIKYEDAFIYQLHVRGFTKHSSSGTRYKGTFKGVIDKLAYIKELGVTTLEFQPVYEFNECDAKTGRLNYWGYCKGYYYSPKAAYSYSKDSSCEFFEMVKSIHSNNIEIIMQMFFPSDFSRNEIVSILEYWTVKYHIDGFRLLGENIPLDLIENSPILSNSKIWADRLDGAKISQSIGSNEIKRYALYRDDYMYSMRRFLKADEFSVNDAIAKLRENNSGFANINYFDTFNSLSLYDMVSYERKHNEDNGEDNRDGSDYNCSWNCGEEGVTRKNKVLALRKKQIKNALLMLIFSAGTPMIYMGDEFGRTQAGNNNPYCQDSKITYVDWSFAKKQFSQVEFIKELLKIRKEYSVLHCNHELSMVDVSGCGYPEISYHGESAWKSHAEGYKHEIGIMYCDSGKLLYMAVNMHWEPVVLSMPRPPKGYVWTPIVTSGESLNDKAKNASGELSVVMPEHTITIYNIQKATGDK